MFHSAVLKLTGFYVLIVMLISVAFSVALFQLSSQEINRGLTRQGRAFLQFTSPEGSPFGYLEQTRLEQLTESAAHLKLNLLYFNLLILLISAGVSYWLARRTLQPIEEMMEAQNRFTADASHELRTPITALKTEIEVGLRDEKLDLTASKALLKSNLEEIAKLEALSGSLLKIARHDTGNHLELAQNNLREITMEAFRSVEKLAVKKQIDFQFHLDDVFAKVDRSRIKEMFVILMDNAIKYSPAQREVSVTIKKDNNQALITISDQGYGIKASDLPYIFNRFYRADSSRAKDKADGYGLGLSIAKQIVDSHKGKIIAESKIGRGTTFIVTLILENS